MCRKPSSDNVQILPPYSHKKCDEDSGGQDSLAERSKAVAQGAIPQGRGLEPHSCHILQLGKEAGDAESSERYALPESTCPVGRGRGWGDPVEFRGAEYYDRPYCHQAHIRQALY